MAKMTSGELKRKILRRLGGEKKGMSMDALASALRIRKGDRPGFLLALGRLEQNGEILRNKKGKYTLAGINELRARMLSLNRGFGFARPEEGEPTALSPADT